MRDDAVVACGLVARGTQRFRWGTRDEKYGRDSAFLDAVDALGRWYLVEVPHDTRVWLQRPALARRDGH